MKEKVKIMTFFFKTKKNRKKNKNQRQKIIKKQNQFLRGKLCAAREFIRVNTRLFPVNIGREELKFQL